MFGALFASSFPHSDPNCKRETQELNIKVILFAYLYVMDYITYISLVNDRYVGNKPPIVYYI